MKLMLAEAVSHEFKKSDQKVGLLGCHLFLRHVLHHYFLIKVEHVAKSHWSSS